MRRLIVLVFVFVLLGTTGAPASARVNGGGGLDDGRIWAGVLYGTPPSSDGSTDRNGCRWEAANPRDAGSGFGGFVERDIDGVPHMLFDRICESGTTYVWVARVSSERLARAAADAIEDRLPTPRPGTAPPADAGVVKVGMWFWTAADTWRPVSVTAWVPTPDGIAWATTTATPRSLVLSPGDSLLGDGDTRCTGPGIVWRPVDGDRRPSPCSYTYRHSSSLHPTGRFPATLAIEWDVSWRSNVGGGGALAPATTRTPLPLTIDEIQALVSE